MLKHCSPSSVDLRRRSRRNLLSLADDRHTIGVTDMDASVSSNSSTGGGFCHVIDISTSGSTGTSGDDYDDGLDLCEDVVSVKSFENASNNGSSSTGGVSPVSGSGSASSTTEAFFNKRVILRKQESTVSRVKSTPLKIYARCLRSDIEYKTLNVNHTTTCRDLIVMLLSKFRMKHRDPKLFYLTMDIYIKRTGIPLKKTLVLDDESRPAELKSCHPWGECKFTLQTRKGGLVRVYDSVLFAASKYKCLLISEATTAKDVIKLLFNCYSIEPAAKNIDRYSLYEHIVPNGIQRKLASEELPVLVQSQWVHPENSRFVLKMTSTAIVTSNEKIEAVEAEAKEGLAEDDELSLGGDSGCDEKMNNCDQVFARPAMIIEEVDTEMHLDTSYCSSGESTASSEFSALRFRDSPMSASGRSNASSEFSAAGQPLQDGELVRASGGVVRILNPGPPPRNTNFEAHRPPPRPSANQHLFKKNPIVCSHHKGLQCTTISVSKHYSLSSLLETLPAASVDSEDYNFSTKHSSSNSLSSESRYSDYDAYFYI